MSRRIATTTVVLMSLLVHGRAVAQITIESSVIGSLIGTTVEQTEFSADAGQEAAIQAIFNQSGENQTWDFTGLAWTSDGTFEVDYVELPAELPGSEDPRVADANYAIRVYEPPGQEEYQFALYFQLTPTGQFAYGSSAVTTEGTVDILFDSGLFELPFPLFYGIDPWEGSTTYQISAEGFTQNVQVDLEGRITGHGTLILPGQDPVAALRFEETRTMTTTIDGVPIPLVSSFTNVSFLTTTITNGSVVQTSDGFGGSVWSATYSVVSGGGGGTEPPADPPASLDPADGAADVATDPTLSWNAVGDADTYDLQVATDASFSKRSSATLVVDETGLTASSFEVSGLDNATQYFWRVRGVNEGGAGPWSAAVSFTTVAGTSIEARDVQTPSEFALVGNYPNPFNPSTTITFDVAKSTPVRVTIHDALGRELDVLADRSFSPGRYDVSWDAAGRPSGSYLVRLETASFSATRTIVLLK